MRLAVAVAVAALGGLIGCETHYGLYVTVDRGDLQVDRVELHFGIHVADSIPLTYGVQPLAGMQQLFKHDAHADALTDVSEREVTYYIPSSEPIKAGYVLAIGYAGTQRVAIGEHVLPKLPQSDEVFEYKLALESMPSGQIARWGTQDQCFAWTRERAFGFSSIALVPADDNECLMRQVAQGCDIVLECNTSPCPTIQCITDKCQLGVCEVSESDPASGVCKPTACLFEQWCSSTLCPSPPQPVGTDADLFLSCWRKMASGIEAQVQHTGSSYCHTMFEFFLPTGVPCLNPQVVHPLDSPILITAGNNNSCFASFPATLLPEELEHALFTVDTQINFPTTFILGIHLGTINPDCSPLEAVVFPNMNVFAPTCTPP